MASFVGIDVQVKRGCTYCALDENGRLLDHGWLTPVRDWAIDVPVVLQEATDLARSLLDSGQTYVGIDSPRTPLDSLRHYSFRRRRWEPNKDGMLGRHCEVAVKALGLANPQWTPLRRDAKPWMKLGFKLFDQLEEHADVFEVFPTASYRMLKDSGEHLLVPLPFESLAPGPKDYLDAVISAVTILRFVGESGAEVGGGDGLGSIVLPRALADSQQDHASLSWPA